MKSGEKVGDWRQLSQFSENRPNYRHDLSQPTGSREVKTFVVNKHMAALSPSCFNHEGFISFSLIFYCLFIDISKCFIDFPWKYTSWASLTRWLLEFCCDKSLITCKHAISSSIENAKVGWNNSRWNIESRSCLELGNCNINLLNPYNFPVNFTNFGQHFVQFWILSKIHIHVCCQFSTVTLQLSTMDLFNWLICWKTILIVRKIFWHCRLGLWLVESLFGVTNEEVSWEVRHYSKMTETRIPWRRKEYFML